MKNKKVLNVGIVGLGEHMVRAHVAHLINRPDVRIKSYSDPNPHAHLALPAETFLGVAKASYEEILADPEVDVVFIGSPDQFHSAQLIKAVEAGKHVFCEKPMCVTYDGARDLVRAIKLAKFKGLRVSTCHPRRFDPPVLWLKKALDQGFIRESVGILSGFEFNFWYHEVKDEWKKNRSLLSDHFGHELDLFRFLFPAIDDWKATKITDAHDRYKVQLVGNSITATFSGYRTLAKKEYQESVRLSGDQGSLILHLNSGTALNERSGSVIHFPAIDYVKRFKGVNDNFIESIVHGAEAYLSSEDMFVNNISSAQLVEEGCCAH